MTPLYIIHRSPGAGERWIIHNAAPCCVRPLAVGAVELIKQLALFEGNTLTAPNYRNPHGTTKPCCVRPLAVGAVELIKQLALFGKLLDYLYQLLT